MNNFTSSTPAALRLIRPYGMLTGAAFLLVGTMLVAQQAHAELLCDCTQVIGSCSASVGLDGRTVDISSDTAACSRVDYLIEGQPFAALVVDGRSQLAWPGLPQRDASIVVESCRICAESGSAAAGATPASDSAMLDGADDEANLGIQPIIKVLPDYPRGAWMNQVEGDVIVEYAVTATGSVTDIRIARSSSPVFDMASVNAVNRFKFRPAEEGEENRTGLREEFRFRLVDGGTRTSVSSVSP